MAFVETTKDQAHSNYVKNRGNPGQWFQHTADYREPQPAPRVRPEAQDIATKQRPTVGEVFHNYRLPPDSQPAPVRLRDDDARRIADKFNNQEDKWFDFHGNYAFRPKPRPVKVYPPTNVEAMQRVNQAREGDWFDHTKKADPQMPSGPKCTSEAGREIATAMRRSQADWYRHDGRPSTAPSVRCSSRTRVEGAEYAERNQHGTGTDWMTRKLDPSENDVAVYGHRCPTNSAQANYEASAVGQQMRECFNYSRGSHQDPPPAAAKVKGGLAQEIYERNTRGALATAGQAGEPARAANKTRPEAQEIANNAKGRMSQWFDQEQNKSYSSPRPQPRVRPGPAQEAAEKNRGVMDSCLAKTDYRPPPKDHKTHERAVKTELAKELASKGRGDATKSLLSNSSLPPEPPRKSKALSYGAEDNAARNQGTASLVITGAAPPSARAPAMRVRPEASDTAQKYRGGDFFKTIQMRPPSAR